MTVIMSARFVMDNLNGKMFAFPKIKMKFSIKDFFSKYDRIWSHLLKISLMENFFFCAVTG